MKKWNWNNPVTWKQIFTINIVGSIAAVAGILVSLTSYDRIYERIKNVRAGFRNKETEEEDN